MATFSELLTKHTLRAGISDSELARTTGVQRQTIFRWKEGLSTRPRYRDDLVRIAARLRLTPAETAELLLAAGFPPDDPTAGATAFESAQHPTDDAELEPVNDEKAGAENMPVAAADQAGATPSAPAFAGDLSLHKRGMLWLWATLALAAAGATLLYLLRTTPLPPPAIAVTVRPPVLEVSTASPSPTPVIAPAAEGETLIAVAPFVGYTSNELQFNVAGRIEEALAAVIARNRLPATRVVLLPLAVASRSTAEELLRTTKAAILIWGEYDAGRVKVNLEVADAQAVDGASLVDRAWERSVSSPAELTPVINTAVPREVQSLALLALGWLARRAGDAALATTLFEEGLALQPETTDTAAALHFYLGALLGTPQGDLAKAIDHYAAALALKPNWPTLYYNRGSAYLYRAMLAPEEAPDLQLALADLSQAIRRLPTVDAYFNRAIVYYQRDEEGDPERSIADLTAALALKPAQAGTLFYQRALAHIRLDAASAWQADLAAAAAADPSLIAVATAWCWALAIDGLAGDALPYCNRAVANDPQGFALDGRAIAQTKLGHPEAAVADLQAYIAWVRQTYPGLEAKFRVPEAEEWIATIAAGGDPFTEELLGRLRRK
jgi:tetratricopeptide (TPR) repeat protein/transcriptional regulator with XRE-family HTH domain